ncbi:hypothetical protein [Paraburkholderia sp. DGU8]|uniref:hypothetical protein n=1 Tax=Paraburkholderia sp. DGU8 TaxID=3161997 RepID=UPI003466372F
MDLTLISKTGPCSAADEVWSRRSTINLTYIGLAGRHPVTVSARNRPNLCPLTQRTSPSIVQPEDNSYPHNRPHRIFHAQCVVSELPVGLFFFKEHNKPTNQQTYPILISFSDLSLQK